MKIRFVRLAQTSDPYWYQFMNSNGIGMGGNKTYLLYLHFCLCLYLHSIVLPTWSWVVWVGSQLLSSLIFNGKYGTSSAIRAANNNWIPVPLCAQVQNKHFPKFHLQARPPTYVEQPGPEYPQIGQTYCSSAHMWGLEKSKNQVMW